MNIRIITASLILAAVFTTGNAQQNEELPAGKPIAKIYADYRHQLNGAGSFTGFGVSRAFLGYSYKVDSHLSAQIILDIASPLRNEENTFRRYAFIRNAFIAYRFENLTITAGISDGRGHVEPNNFWGKRYISRPFLLNYFYTIVADIGIIADYSISNTVSFNLQVMNGEGFTNIQNDSTLLYGAGVTVRPSDRFVARFFADTYKKGEARKNTLATFAGYKHDKFSLGAEFNYKTDYDWTDSHNVYGYSIMASYYLGDHFELFCRYDRSSSVILEGEQDPWNILRDGSLLISGIQYTLSKHLRLALDYQGWTPLSAETPRWDYIQANVEFKF
jgi:hypothetical protein